MNSLYYYAGRSADGRLVRGSIEAQSESGALASLRARALFVTSFHAASGARGALAGAPQLGPVSGKHLVAFFRCFSTLVRAGVAVRRSLDVTMEQCSDARLREALAAVACDIENGLSLSDAMGRRPREFSPLLVALVKAGELGGNLDEALERLAWLLERDRAVRKRLLAAMTYPAVVASAAVAVLLLLLTSIIPAFRSTYDQLHVPLPPMTTALLDLAWAFHSPALWIAGSIVACACVLYAVQSRGNPRHGSGLPDALLRVPVLSGLLRKTALGRMARTVGTLLRSGVGLVPAIEMSVDTISISAYRTGLRELCRSLAEGSPVYEQLARSSLYDPLFVQLVRAGEETGALDAMLLRLAEYYDLEVEAALSVLGSLLEPALILFMGTAVGFIVAAMFVPLYTLIGNMR